MESLSVVYRIATRREYLGYALGAIAVFVLWSLPDATTLVKTGIVLISVFVGLPAIRKFGN